MRTLDINEGNWIASGVAGLSPWTSVTVIAVITKKKKRDFIVVSTDLVIKHQKIAATPYVTQDCIKV
jgi:hypothetical protein